MTVLMRTSEITGRPLVTYAGEDVAQIKDVAYGGAGGQVAGFTLNGRGVFAGPLKQALPWRSIAALGPDAVMIVDERVLVDVASLSADGGGRGGRPAGGDVLGSQVLTDDGTDLGKVVDVVIQVPETTDSVADVVGYEIEPSEALGQDVKRVLIPLPDTLAASGEHLMVPSAARDFVAHDLAGFGAAVDAFRARLRESA